MSLLTINDIDIHNKRILIREDFNVPIIDGVIQSDLRIRAALPGIKQALAAGAQLKLMSHLGRPSAPDPQFSLRPIALKLQDLLDTEVTFLTELTESTAPLVLYENVRFFPGEVENSSQLAKQMAGLCDVFVLDAFGSAHRAHASTVGVCEFAKIAVAGPLLMQEITALSMVMQNQKHPVVAVVGGAKVSSKFEVIGSLLNIADFIIIGGGMANTFLAAQGMDVKRSLYEPEFVPMAQQLLDKTDKILLPSDVVWSEDRIMDIGVISSEKFVSCIGQANTIIWNGPMGVFEEQQFSRGTEIIAKAIANSRAYTVAGGGDTIAAIDKWNLAMQLSYISTGGGAFLEYIEGKQLPAIQALINKSTHDITT